MPGTLTLYDPTAPRREAAAPRDATLSALKGAVVGFIDNAKIGTERFFDFLEEILRSRYGVREAIRRRKPDATRPAPRELLAAISGADAIVSGIGD